MDLGVEILSFLMVVAFMAGFIDAIAGGGGLLTIPALMTAGMPPVAALATNKLQSTFATGGAFLAFVRAGHIDLRRFAAPAAGAFFGSALGAFAVQKFDPSFLAALIPALLIAIAVYFLVARKLREEDRHARIGPAGLVAVTALIGCYDGFFGPGTGSFFLTALIALGGLGLVRAIAHAKLLNFASNLAGLAVLAAGGHTYWTIGFAMALASMAGGQLGAHTAMRFGARAVRPLLVIMSLALTVKLLVDPENSGWEIWGPIGALLTF